MKIFARYPAKELTIHARVREDFYKGALRLDAFDTAVRIYRENGGKADICYNGDVTSPAFGCMNKATNSEIDSSDEMTTDSRNSLDTINRLRTLSCYNEISSIMIGRGLLTNPALARELSGGPALTAQELKTYLQKLYEGYETYIPEERNVIFKLLEHWAFLDIHFADSEKCMKAIRKSRSKGEYFAAVNNIFSSCQFI